MPKTDDSILDDSLCISTRLAISVQSMGLKPGNVVLSLGVVSFNLFEELGNLHVVFNMAEQLKAGLTLDPDTLAWWAETDPDTLLQLIIQTNAEKATLHNTLGRMVHFARDQGCRKSTDIWVYRSSFVFPILKRLCEAAGAEWAFHHNAEQDYGTLKKYNGRDNADYWGEAERLFPYNNDALMSARRVAFLTRRILVDSQFNLRDQEVIEDYIESLKGDDAKKTITNGKPKGNRT